SDVCSSDLTLLIFWQRSMPVSLGITQSRMAIVGTSSDCNNSHASRPSDAKQTSKPHLRRTYCNRSLSFSLSSATITRKDLVTGLNGSAGADGNCNIG